MRKVVLVALIAAFSAPKAGSVEPVSFSPASLVSRSTGEGPTESVISVFPPGGTAFDIPLTLTTRWFTYGPSGKSAYASAFKQTGPRSFTDQRGVFKIDLDPVRVSIIPGLDAFYSAGPFALSHDEDFLVFGGAKGNYPAGRCGVYKAAIPAGDVSAVIETSDCRVGSPWRVLSVSPEGNEALITGTLPSVGGGLALLDLTRGSLTKLEGQLYAGSFSPDGKWIAALQRGDPTKAPSKTMLLDRTDLSKKRDLGGVNDTEIVWSPDSKFLLHAVPRPACPSQNPLALETLEVATGNRALIKDSICNAGSSRQIGWIRSDVKR